MKNPKNFGFVSKSKMTEKEYEKLLASISQGGYDNHPISETESVLDFILNAEPLSDDMKRMIKEVIEE